MFFFFISFLAGITFQCKQAIFIRIRQLFHNRAAHGWLLCVKFPNQLQKQPAFWHLPPAKLSHHLPSCLCQRNLCHCERGAVSCKSGKKQNCKFWKNIEYSICTGCRTLIKLTGLHEICLVVVQCTRLQGSFTLFKHLQKYSGNSWVKRTPVNHHQTNQSSCTFDVILVAGLCPKYSTPLNKLVYCLAFLDLKIFTDTGMMQKISEIDATFWWLFLHFV